MKAKSGAVFSATYSGVLVYEISIGESSVMRRAQDGFLNATQILKVAGFSKAHRMKILEEDVLSGSYERVQGGHGKYQGTWVPLETARVLAQRYGVYNQIGPLLNIESEDAEALLNNSAGNAKNADSAAITKRTPARSRNPSSSIMLASPERGNIQASPLSPPRNNHQEPTPKYAGVDTTGESSLSSISKRLFDEESAQQQFIASVHVKRNRSNKEGDFSVGDINNYSFEPPIANISLPKQTPQSRKQELLMHIFVKQDNGLNNAYFFELLRNSTDKSRFDVDIVLDDRKSTCLHWASQCGRLNLATLLIARGASALSVAENGETPLIRSIHSSFLYAQRNMNSLLTLLGSSLFAVDQNRRSVLHHVVLLSKYRSKRAISNYYMECISNFIEDTRESIQQSYNMFLDASDKNGDSALHIACRYRNHRIVYLLLSLGASNLTQNLAGETPLSIATSDPRLLKLMDNYPDPTFDDYLDAPTTPMSDISDLASEVAPVSKGNQLLMASYPSSSTLSSVGYTPDALVFSTAAQLNSSRMYISELKSQKQRFEDVSKYALKIQAILDRPATPQPIIGTQSSTSFGGAEGEDVNAKRKQPSQRTLMTETKLSSRLIRLESLVKASIEEQYDLLRRIDLIKEERTLKDERYCRLITNACHLTDIDNMEDLLSKIDESM